MLPGWFTKLESLFRTILWVFGPFFGWWVSKVILRRVEAWHAARSETTARASLIYLYKALENPPTLLESLAYIICFLPLPIALTSALLSTYFDPFLRPHSDFLLPPEIGAAFVSLLSFVSYLIFGVLTVHGVTVAYRLRHGEARYSDNYKAEIQKRIDRLKKKFPGL
jgi:hypothetical protein